MDSSHVPSVSRYIDGTEAPELPDVHTLLDINGIHRRIRPNICLAYYFGATQQILMILPGQVHTSTYSLHHNK